MTGTGSHRRASSGGAVDLSFDPVGRQRWGKGSATGSPFRSITPPATRAAHGGAKRRRPPGRGGRHEAAGGRRGERGPGAGTSPGGRQGGAVIHRSTPAARRRWSKGLAAGGGPSSDRPASDPCGHPAVSQSLGRRIAKLRQLFLGDDAIRRAPFVDEAVDLRAVFQLLVIHHPQVLKPCEGPLPCIAIAIPVRVLFPPAEGERPIVGGLRVDCSDEAVPHVYARVVVRRVLDDAGLEHEDCHEPLLGVCCFHGRLTVCRSAASGVPHATAPAPFARPPLVGCSGVFRLSVGSRLAENLVPIGGPAFESAAEYGTKLAG